MNLSRSSGVLVHPTSFPNKFGIGDLGKSAYEFIDFLHKSQQKLWQILPLGPTSFGDSPYQSFSTFAGNSLLISPELLVKQGYLDEEDLFEVPNFNPCKIDYGEVINYKSILLRKAYKNFKEKGATAKKNSFKKFCKKNKDWLDDFALFISLKNYYIEERKNDIESEEYLQYKKANADTMTESTISDFYYGAVWNTWPQDIKKRYKKAISEYTNKLSEEIEYYKFLQYEFFRQWFSLKNYANQLNIKIIGDIPIFVSLDSSDVWANPNLFYLNEAGNPTVVAGVPPDYFSSKGQLWGNPLYNWDVHKKTKYSWWIERIKNALSTVDIIRIDHFRGIESYWAVDFGKQTAEFGKWCKGPGKALFDAIKQDLGHLPIIAEDLGIITEEVTKLRKSLDLPGMKVLQFAFDLSETNNHLPHNLQSPDTVLYTGTHDNDTSVGWYNKSGGAEKDLFRRYMNVSGEEPSWDLIRLCFASVAAYAIIPIQDIMSLDSDCRMNTPGTSEGNWQFRYTGDLLTEEMAERILYLTKLFER